MSISSVSSATSPQAANQNQVNQLAKSFNAIGSALQSGDVSNAQSALTTFQQALQSSSQTTDKQPFGKNAMANMDYQSLTNDLQSGDLAGAQKAFTSLQNDLTSPSTQSVQSAYIGHHHHHHATATATNSPATLSSTNGSSTPGSNGTLNTVA
jgi:hypothetical protein